MGKTRADLPVEFQFLYGWIRTVQLRNIARVFLNSSFFICQRTLTKKHIAFLSDVGAANCLKTITYRMFDIFPLLFPISSRLTMFSESTL